MNELDLIIEVVSLILDNLKHSGMIDNAIGTDNAQEYNAENCKKYGIPYLKSFVDIDTYTYESGRGNHVRQFRIQGYILIKILDFEYWTCEQLSYLIDLIKNKKYMTEITEKDGFPCVEVWNA